MEYRLGELVQIDSGYAFKSDLFNDKKDGIPIIRIRDVNSGKSKTYFSGEYDEKYLVKDSELLISMDGSFIIKKWAGGKSLLNQRVCRIRSINSILLDEYIYRILPFKLKKIEDATPFVTVKHLSVKALEEIKIYIPKVEVQSKIVDILDKSEALIDKRKAQIEALDELVKSQFIELFGDLVKNEKDYPLRKLKDIAMYYNGLTYKPEYVVDNGTIVLRSSNIQNSSLEFNDVVRVECPIKEKLYVQQNDILMCSRNGSARLVGKVALINDIKEPMTFGAFMMIIRSRYYTYLMAYFQHDAFRRQIATGATTTINQITGKMLDDIVLPIPDEETLNQFTSFVQKVDKLKVEMQESLKQLEDNFNSLMQRSFKGEII